MLMQITIDINCYIMTRHRPEVTIRHVRPMKHCKNTTERQYPKVVIYNTKPKKKKLNSILKNNS